MIVSRCTGNFVAFGSLVSEGTGSPEPEGVVHFGSRGSSSVVVHLVSECFWCFVEFVFGAHHPNPPLYSYKWGSLVPICIVLP